MIGIVLIDDHELLREGLARLFAQEPGFEILGQCSTAEDGLSLVMQHQPDVITLDLSLPGMNGRDLAVKLLALDSPPKIIILSSEVDSVNIKNLVSLGIQGYVSKSAPSSDIVRAIKMVTSGQNYFSPDVMTVLIQGDSSAPKLTLRQMEVLSSAAKGLTTKEIAELLHVSPKTVEKYRGEIIARLEAKNLIEAIDKARKYKLIS